MSTSLSLRHFLLALSVVAVWGSNFAIIKATLVQMPPLLLATLRFAAAFVPMALFLRKPAVRWRNLAAYGLLIGVGQFGVMYIAMNGQISPGVASLVVQTQVFFTIGMAMVLAGESLQKVQWLALGLAASGLVVIAVHTDGSTTLLGLAMTLAAALAWAIGNLVSRRAGAVNMVAYVVWSSLFAVPPLLGLALWFEGWTEIRAAFVRADRFAWLAVIWQSWGNAIFGYGAWAWLLSRYNAATITPMALLVPVFGMATASLYLGETLPPWKLGAAALVMSGLALNILWPWWLQQRRL